MVTAYDIFMSRFAQMSAAEISTDEKEYQKILKERWRSVQINNTELSAIRETFDEDLEQLIATGANLA